MLSYYNVSSPFRNNFMSVDVFMKELSYEEIEQQVAYDLTSLWSKST